MDITLINPPQPYLITPKTQVPLGVLYLSAVLKHKQGVHVTVFDASDSSIQEAVEKIPESDVYGYTATSLDYNTQKKLMNDLKNKYPNAKHIVGGPHATVLSKETLQDGFDSVFIGEAEDSILSFVDDFLVGTIKNKYQGIDRVDIKKLPYPDRDALSWVGGQVLVNDASSSMNIMASRGCPYNCHFCASATMWKRKLRWRNVESVVSEIKHYKEKYGISIYRFSDDNMVSNRQWTERFCELIKPVDIKWRLSARVDKVDPQILKTMKEAGCTEIGFGCESFDQNVLNILNKNITPMQSIQAIKWCHDVGIGPRILMMVNTPGETYKKTIEENYKYLDSIRGKFTFLSFKILMPLPGTAIWNNPDKFGIKILNKDFSKYNFYTYQRDDTGKKKFVIWSAIQILSMTADEQKRNAEMMFEYANTFPENSTGDF